MEASTVGVDAAAGEANVSFFGCIGDGSGAGAGSGFCTVCGGAGAGAGAVAGAATGVGGTFRTVAGGTFRAVAGCAGAARSQTFVTALRVTSPSCNKKVGWGGER